MSDPVQNIVGIAAAAVGGLAVGIERQWSGHAEGPGSRFAGMRTFALLGGLAGLAGWLWTRGYELVAATLLGGAAALVVAAYVAASRRDVEGTTEVAALVVLAAGFLSGAGNLALGSGVIALTVLMLVEKTRLHGLVARLNDEEMRAGARFAVMAVVILPLLPVGPYGPFGGIRPREMWALVLLFSGLSFAGYVARRAVGVRRGYPIAGMLGGLASSTQVALSFSRVSASEPGVGVPLACGVVAASTVLFVRLLIATALLDRSLAVALLPYALPPLAVGSLVAAAGYLRSPAQSAVLAPARNPLQFSNAVQMGLLFQIVLVIVHVLRESFGRYGILTSGAIIGFTDMDAVTISMARSVSAGVAPGLAAQAVALGALSNTLLKLAIAVGTGRGAFRPVAAVGLGAIGLAVAVPLVVLW